MANDGEVNIGTKVDESGLDKGLRSVKNKVKNTSKDLNKGAKAVNGLKTAFNETGGAAAGFASKMGSVASSGGAVAAGITAAIMAAKKYIETLKQASEAYKVQEKAENALSKAAENNPYLNKDSIQRLKDYASELQSVSNFGDEGTIDVMAQLAAAGRNESEIMKLVAAAADYAAAKHISLESAVQNLNKSYGGLAGELGELFPEVKALTAEQLKNGEAVDIIAQKYKGFAAEAADSSTQAKNAFGDFMESVGKIANPFFESLKQRAKSFWEGMTEQMSKFNDALETASRKWGIGGIHRAVDEGVNVINSTYTNRETGQEKRGADFQTTDYLKWLKEELEWREKLTDEEEAALFEINMELKARERLATYEKEQAAAAAKKNAENKKQQEAAKTANDYAAASNKALEESLNLLEVEAKAKGTSGSAQDRYNVYLQSYIDLLTKTNDMIKEGYPIEQRRLKELEDAKKKLDEEADAEARLAAAMEMTQAAVNAINSVKRQLTPAEEMQAEIDQLEALKNQIKAASDEEIAAAQAGQDAQLNKTQLLQGLTDTEKALMDEKIAALTEKEKGFWDQEADKQKQISEVKQALDESEILSTEEKYKRMEELDEAYRQSKAAQIADLTNQIASYTSQTVDVINNAANLMLETSENEAEAEQAALEEKYLNGEISEEEYNKAVTESKKKAAKEQYKIQMIQWGASILQATANIAQGVTQAIAQGGVAGLITGGLVAAAGAVQIASIIASKPTPPNFAGGGFIGGMNGASMGADNTYIHARTGEMVANAAQQRKLWEAMNGNGSGGGGTNIVINNSASNIATAQPKLTRDKIEIMIDARVNDSMKNGRYDQSMNEAHTGMTGDYYGV